MDTRTATPDLPAATQKRPQRFLRFQLKPGDEEHLKHLNDKQRQILLSDGTYQEKAQRFGIPVGTVRSRIHRARAAIEAMRGEQPNTEEQRADESQLSQPH